MKSKLSKEELAIENERRKKDKGRPLADKIYNSLIDRYTRNGNAFNNSDAFVWQGAVYELPTLFGYIIFFAIFLYLAHLSFERYGDARTIVFVMLLIMWRVQIMIKLLSKINQKF